MIVPSLADAADAAVSATYEMRSSTDLDDLAARRRAAIEAARQFRATAARQFKAAGIGLALPRDMSMRSPTGSDS